MRGEAIVTNVERDAHMVEDLLELKAEVDIVLVESFSNSEKFKNAVKDAFEAFINRRPNKPAECIGKLPNTIPVNVIILSFVTARFFPIVLDSKIY